MHSSDQAEYLNTPRQIFDEQQQLKWRWDQGEPFGAGACNPDPDGDNVQFEFNLRFPGQYFDKETNAHYNHRRDYDQQTGRYVESDPIGLQGGLNTYLYVTANPLVAVDPTGLAIWICNRQVNIGGGLLRVGNHAYLWDDTTGRCCGRNTGYDPFTSCFERGPSALRPGGDSCIRIPDTHGIEDTVMACCRRRANDNPWFPYANDCHDSADRCFSAYGMKVPKATGGRVGRCDSCWLKPNPPSDGNDPGLK